MADAGASVDRGVGLTLILAPCAMGLVHAWAMIVPAVVVLVLATRAALRSGGIAAPPRGMTVAFAAALAGLLFSLLPLPSDWLALLSPGSAAVLSAGVPGEDAEPGFRALHVAPMMGADRLLRWVALAAWVLACGARAGRTSFRRAVRFGLLFGSTLAVAVGVAHTLLHERALFGVWRPRFDARIDALWPMINENHWGAFLGMAAIVGLDLATSPRTNRRVRVAGAAAGVLAAAVVLSGHSLGSQGALGLSVLALLLMRARVVAGDPDAPAGGRRQQAVAVLLIVAPLLVGVLVFRALEASAPLRYADTGGELERSGLFAKVHLFRTVGAVVAAHPLFGTGPGALIDTIPRFDPSGQRLAYPWAESLPLQLMVDLGVPLASLVLVALAWSLVPALRASSRRWEHHGAVAALLGLAAHELVDTSLSGGAVAFTATALVATLHRSEAPSRNSAARLSVVAALGLLLAAGAGAWVREREPSDVLPRHLDALRNGRTELTRVASTMHRRYPSSYPLALDLAGLFVHEGDLRRAFLWLNRAQWLAPHATEPHVHAARLLASAGAESQAAIEYRLAAHLDWRHQGEEILGEAIVRIRDPQALAELAAPELPESLPRLAWMLRQRKDPRADALAERAMVRAADHPITLLVAAHLALAREDKAEARVRAQALVSHPEGTSALRVRAAEVLWWCGDREAAAAQLRAILDSPTSVPTAEDWLQLARWSQTLGKAVDARLAFRRARSLGSASVAAATLVEEARAERDAGESADAQVLLTRAERLDPRLIDVHLLMAELMWAEGRTDAARGRVRRALQLDGAHLQALDLQRAYALPTTPPMGGATP